MNPFRDRRPERLADIYLDALRRRDSAFVKRLPDTPRHRHILETEAEIPPISWRLDGRWDSRQGVWLAYRVERWHDYESDVTLVFEFENGAWKLADFDAWC